MISYSLGKSNFWQPRKPKATREVDQYQEVRHQRI